MSHLTVNPNVPYLIALTEDLVASVPPQDSRSASNEVIKSGALIIPVDGENSAILAFSAGSIS